MKRHAVIAATLAALLLLAPLHANAQADGDQWRFALTPYLWLPNVDGTLKFSVPPGAGGSPSVEVGPNSYLENLDFALMLAGEARRGNWAIISDLIYLDFSNEDGAVKSVAGPVVAMLAVGEGSRKKVLDQISAMGTNLMTVRPGAPGIRGEGDIITLVPRTPLLSKHCPMSKPQCQSATAG